MQALIAAVEGALEAFRQGFRAEAGRENLRLLADSLHASLPGCDILLDCLGGRAAAAVEGVCLDEPLGPGDAVLVDLSVGVRGKWCDLTRTFFLPPVPRELRRAYAAVRRSLRAGEGVLRAGASGGELHAAVARSLEREGYRLLHHAGHRLGVRPVRPPEFVAGEGRLLPAGCRASLESGVYDAAAGWGLRLEHDYLVTEQGCRRLSGFSERVADCLLGVREEPCGGEETCRRGVGEDGEMV